LADKPLFSMVSEDATVEINVLAGTKADTKADPKTDNKPETNSSKSADDCDTVALTMAADAVNKIYTSYYFIPSEDPIKDSYGTVGSIWGTDDTQMTIGHYLKSPNVLRATKVLSCLLMLASMFEQPRIWHQVPYEVGWGITTFVLVIFWAIFGAKMWCMLPQREHWFKGSSDERWTLFLGLCLCMSTLGLILEWSEAVVEQCNTIHQSNVKFNRVALWLRISRCYYLIYFSPSIREGIVSSIRIFYDLGELFLVIIIFFLIHYFAYDAAMSHDNDVCTNGVCTSIWKQNLGGNSGEAKDGLWNMFILLTTANHPDIVMNFYDRYPASFFMLVSFMIITFYFLMNLLLGEVYTQYERHFINSIMYNRKISAALINTCYQELVQVNPEDPTDSGITKPVFDQLIEFSRPTDNFEKHTVWFAMLDTDQSGYVGRDEFQKFEEVRDAPLSEVEQTTISEKEEDLKQAIAAHRNELKTSEKVAKKKDVEALRKELEELQAEEDQQNSPYFPLLNAIFVSGSMKDARPSNDPDATKFGDAGWRATPADADSKLQWVTWPNFVDALTALSIGYMALSDPRDTCSEAWALGIEIFITSVFVIDVAVRIPAEMLNKNKAAFFNTTIFNYIDLVAAIMMTINVFLCTGPGITDEARAAVAVVRIFRCLRLMYNNKKLYLMVKVCRKTLALVAPQFILFVLVYFGFGTLGMALFTGDTTKVLSEGGPGEWTTEPWASTAYGSTSYYYSLNFDNIGRSFFTLFTLMVQNNWSVTADGFMQTNDRWSRIFFFVFNVTAVMVMINIFISTVMKFYGDLLAEEENGDAQTKERLEPLVRALANVPHDITEGKWKIQMKLEDADDLLLAPEDIQANIIQGVRQNTEAMQNMKQDRAILDEFPIGICVQSRDGRYTWANRTYRALTITDEAYYTLKDQKREVANELKPEALIQEKMGTVLKERADKDTGMSEKAQEARKNKRTFVLDQWLSKRDWENLGNKYYTPQDEVWSDFDVESYHSETHQGKRYDVITRPIQMLSAVDPKDSEDMPRGTGVVTFLVDQVAGQCKTLQFMKLDNDHDHKITAKEWVAKFGPRSIKQFEKYDLDGNGFITKDEWDARKLARDSKYLEKLAHKKAHKASGQGSGSNAGSSTGSGSGAPDTQALLAHDDDDDEILSVQRLSLQEWIGCFGASNAVQYHRLNNRNNGMVSELDAKTFTSKWMKQLFDTVDSNHSGKIDSDEFLELLSLFTPASNLDNEDAKAGTLCASIVADFGTKGKMNFEQFNKMIHSQGFWPILVKLSMTKPELAYAEPPLDVIDLKYELKTMFDEIDVNDSATITEDELLTAFQERVGQWSMADMSTFENADSLCSQLVEAFGVDKPGHLKFEEFSRMFTEAKLWPYFGLRPEEDCDFSRLWRIPRYKNKSLLDPFSDLHWYRKKQAALYVRDGTHNMTGIYYISAKGDNSASASFLKDKDVVGSVWSDEPAATEWATTLRSAFYCTLLRAVSFLLLAAALFEEPRMWTEIPTTVGLVMSVACTLVIWCVFFIYMRCMWPCRKFWHRGSREEYWLIGLGIALPLCSLGILLDASQEYQSSVDTIFGQVKIDRFAMVLKVTRAYFVLFFSPTMRTGFLSAYKVWAELYNVILLIVISFIMHYFLFLAVMSHNQYKQNIGMNDGKYKDGLWNFFVTLTTANHPDIVMQLYNYNQWVAFILVSFMIFTNYFLMSLLLGVVSDAYSRIYSASISDEKLMERKILLTAYEMCNPCPNTLTEYGMGFEAFSEIVSQYGDGKGDNKDLVEVWFDLMDDDASGEIDFEEFANLKKILNAPLVMRDQSHTKKGRHQYPFFRQWAFKGRLNHLFGTGASLDIGDQVAEVYDHHGSWDSADIIEKKKLFLNEEDGSVAKIEKIETETGEVDAWVNNLPMQVNQYTEVAKIFKSKGWKQMSDFTLEEALNALREREDAENSAVWENSIHQVEKAMRHFTIAYPGPYYTIRYANGCYKVSESAQNLRGNNFCSNWMSYIGWEGFVDFVTIFSIIWSIFVPDGDACDAAFFTVEMIFAVVFAVDVIVSTLGASCTGRPWAYFDEWYRCLDVLSTIGMIVSVCMCAGSSSDKLRKVVGLVRILRCFRLTYSLPNLRRIVECALQVASLIKPQLILFCLQYYAFAVIGMAAFAGDVTKTTAAGGPGYWSESPWDATSFGSTAYYYRLNFDNLLNSFATLFTLMVMNNWGVTVNGYESTNNGGRWVRLYFFIFHIYTVWLSVNILIATIMTGYGECYKTLNTPVEQSDDEDGLFSKLNATRIKPDGTRRCHGRLWRLANAVEDNRSLFADDKDEESIEKKNKEIMQKKMVAQTRHIMKCCPLPLYIMTQGGKFTLVNDAYTLLDTEARKQTSQTTGQRYLIQDLTDRADPNLNRRKMRTQYRDDVFESEDIMNEHITHSETFILKPEVVKDGVQQEYVEKMLAIERYVLTANKLPGTLTYFVPENTQNQEQIEALSPNSKAARAAQEDVLPVEDVEAAPAELAQGQM
jgi:Ca2+-binding EF-hand superfamily protein/PAS domain-containing protein